MHLNQFFPYFLVNISKFLHPLWISNLPFYPPPSLSHLTTGPTSYFTTKIKAIRQKLPWWTPYMYSSPLSLLLLESRISPSPFLRQISPIITLAFPGTFHCLFSLFIFSVSSNLYLSNWHLYLFKFLPYTKEKKKPSSYLLSSPPTLTLAVLTIYCPSCSLCDLFRLDHGHPLPILPHVPFFSSFPCPLNDNLNPANALSGPAGLTSAPFPTLFCTTLLPHSLYCIFTALLSAHICCFLYPQDPCACCCNYLQCTSFYMLHPSLTSSSSSEITSFGEDFPEPPNQITLPQSNYLWNMFIFVIMWLVAMCLQETLLEKKKNPALFLEVQPVINKVLNTFQLKE